MVAFGIVILFMALLIGFNSYSNWIPAPPPPETTAWNASQVGVIVMVKNEELILERLLKSVAPYGDWLFVCDTGSTDKTQDKVNFWTASLSKSAQFRFIGPFHNFETSRNLCMDAARTWMADKPHVEWLLLPDADFTLEQQSGLPLVMPRDFDLNIMQIRLPPSEGAKGSSNALPLLVRAKTFFGNCRYRLWTHEVLDCCNETKTGYFAPLYWVDHSDGASRPKKLERDITLLEEWIYHYNRTLAKSPNEQRQDLYGRALYYLARAHEDAGHPEQALQLYQIHQVNQPWTNYQFQGRYRTALIKLHQYRNNGQKGNGDWRPIEAAFLEAYGGADGYFRKEVLYYLMWMFQELRQWNRCILYASAGLAAPPVDHSRMPLFLEPEKHEPALFQQGWDHCIYHSKNSPLG